MDEWDFEEWWEDEEESLYEWTEELADRFFLSDNRHLPDSGDDYRLGYLDAQDWWPLVLQLNELVHLPSFFESVEALDDLLRFPGLPTQLLEEPLTFMDYIWEGHLPADPSRRRVDKRRLAKIAMAVNQLMRLFPETAQAAVRAWADVHRQQAGLFKYEEPGDWSDLLSDLDLPPSMVGFGMMITLTLMRWPERMEDLPLPFTSRHPGAYQELLERWESLPNSSVSVEEGVGEAEALFAQGQLAHILAEMGAIDSMAHGEEEIQKEDLDLAYSRLSRAVLWIHDQCRRCPERDEVACKVAMNWPERPVPLLDVAVEIANTSQVLGCIKM
ncbi:MAG: hypothetical protein ACUVWZ_15970 [Anaerolineae bacterium]